MKSLSGLKLAGLAIIVAGACFLVPGNDSTQDLVRVLFGKDPILRLQASDIAGTYERKASERYVEGFHLSPDGRFFDYGVGSYGPSFRGAGRWEYEDRLVKVKATHVGSMTVSDTKSFVLCPMSSDSVNALLRETDMPPYARQTRPYPLTGLVDEARANSNRALQRIYGDYAATVRAEVTRAALTAVAMVRGRIDCRVDSIGWVTCPVCRGYFGPENRAVWDGIRHKSCGALLTLNGL